MLELNANDRDFIEKTINIINELILSGQIDANHVADRLGMSLFQFRQRLTALTDETPQAFIQNVRMRRARHLLDNHPELNISEIATLCAYNDTPNFTRAFKKTFGVTPTQYIDRKG
jgi:AraC-like DNA-binding protein